MFIFSRSVSGQEWAGPKGKIDRGAKLCGCADRGVNVGCPSYEPVSADVEGGPR